MTNEQRLQTELAHLLRLLAPPYTDAWKAHVDAKVEKLVAWDAAYAELPEMLRAAMQTTSKASTPTHESTDRKELSDGNSQ